MFTIELRAAVISLSAIFAFVYGLVHILKDKKGYFYTFSVLGFFSFALGRLFLFFLYIINEANSNYFNLGSLGIVSGYMCIAFACNTIEKTDRIEIQNIRKYKLIALVVPLLYFICLSIMIASGLGVDELTIFFVFIFSVMPCSYCCFRNIITPYPKNSLTYSMRPFFVAVLVFSLCSMLGEMPWLFYDYEEATYITYVILTITASVCYISMPLLLERGNKKWMQV